jgi:hypothetical protein
VPQSLPHWSVGDGVCDCCDGSDELLNPNARCPDTCADHGREQAELRDSLRRADEEGHEKLKQLIAAGRQRVSGVGACNSKLSQGIHSLRRRVRAWRTSPIIRNSPRPANPTRCPSGAISPFAYGTRRSGSTRTHF